VTTIQESGRSQLELIGDILELAKSESEQYTSERENFSLSNIIKKLFALHDTLAKENKISLLSRIEPGLADQWLGDRVRIRQILTNLLGNAIKFSKNGKVVLEIAKDPDYSLENPLLRFSVEDTGIGIPTNQLEHIFSPFAQVDSSDSRKYEGSGLGLAICKRFVNQLGGRIWAESTIGQGSVFIFNIPFEKPVFLHSTDKEQTIVSNNDKTKVAEILVVEDNQVIGLLMTRLLQKMGHHVQVAKHGSEALDKIAEKSFDLIFMDCLMPVMDGFTACQEIRSREKKKGDNEHLPIVAVTALGIGNFQLSCRIHLPNFIYKPASNIH
jgi:CheY-like chemotaxis protein